LCFEGRFSKQNSFIRLKSNILGRVCHWPYVHDLHVTQQYNATNTADNNMRRRVSLLLPWTPCARQDYCSTNLQILDLDVELQTQHVLTTRPLKTGWQLNGETLSKHKTDWLPSTNVTWSTV